MPNNIPIAQNEESQLKRLAAQRALYWTAKKWVAAQMFFTIILVVVLGLLEGRVPAIRPWAALIGLAILSMDSWGFEPIQKRLRLRAARIQEIFDCALLDQEWHELKVGCERDDEEIIEDVGTYAEKYRRKDPLYSKVRDWYPLEVGRAPMHFGRIICQRSNIRWDFKLRRIYGGLTLGLSVTILTAVIVVGLLPNWSVGDLLIILATFSPLLGWGAREFFKQKGASDSLARLMSHSKRLWSDLKSGRLSEEDTKQRSRELQDAIFDSRSNSPVIFEWVYAVCQPKSEKAMRDKAEEMVNEIAHLLPQEGQNGTDPETRDASENDEQKGNQ